MTEAPGKLIFEGFDPERQGLREALCPLGNGYFATRGAAPESIQALVPDYLPELPTDPFNAEESPELRYVSDEIVYSIGPDKKDQEAAIKYDPTNGTISQGDIFFAMN